MSFEVDHIVIKVKNLKMAINKFEGLGFSITAGGDHGFTHNALIPLENDTYIELISTKSQMAKALFKAMDDTGFAKWQLYSRNNIVGRLIKWFSLPPGPVDWCVRERKTIPKTNEHVKSKKANWTTQRKFSRVKKDNAEIRWMLAAPKSNLLPMLIKDITSRKLRVPKYTVGMHANGAILLDAILFPQEDFEIISDQMSSMKYPVQSLDDVRSVLMVGTTCLGSDAKIKPPIKFGIRLLTSIKGSLYIPPDQSLGVPIWINGN
ncbi:MAG: VOC family protein [Robiginitomaculum sp.]